MDVKLPNLGEGADSGTVVSLLVKPGASVKKGQNILELETGKAVAPIPSPADGVVSRLAVKEGDKVSVGNLLLVLTAAETASGASAAQGEGDGKGASGGGGQGAPPSGKQPAAPAPAAPAPAASSAPSPGLASSKRRQAASTGKSTARKADPGDAVEGAHGDDGWVEEVVNENPVAGPHARRIARDLGLDLRVIPGSGKSGQVMVADLKAYVDRLRAFLLRPKGAGDTASGGAGDSHGAEEESATPSIDFSQWGPVTRKPLTQLRRTIAARMVDSATTLPTVTQFDDADVTELDALRKQHAKAYEARGVRLTMTSFFVRTVALLLRKHPVLNASWDEAGDAIVFKDYVHVGLAVDTEAGLLVPVIRDADKKDLATLSGEIQDLASKARERKLGIAEMQGGSFTISNQGGIGGAHFTPIINKPEVAILGLGRGGWKPVVRDGQVVPRMLVPLALTYDHRLIDGGAAARFVVDLVEALRGYTDADVRI
ncbi:MAG: 2-oxo acid dehydrogenase subunit E2 [Limisphaerales bacterium]